MDSDTVFFIACLFVAFALGLHLGAAIGGKCG